MRIFSRSTLRHYWQRHADSEQVLKAWYQEAERSIWRTPNEMKAEYPSASILADHRVVFNIKGNTYRLIGKINYDYGAVWIRFIGTHAEYDKIDAAKI